MLDLSANEILKLSTSYVLLLNILGFAIGTAWFALSGRELRFKTIVIFLSALMIIDILILVYVHYKANDISMQVVKSFSSSKELVCTHRDIKVIVSKDRSYITKGEYFIKDDVVIDVDVCKTLIDK